MNQIHKRHLVLASQSPRRSEILRRAGIEFAISLCQISEIPDENMNLEAQIQDLARRKAVACEESGKVAKGQGNLILSADTVVVLDGQILGKPRDHEENALDLGRLAGRTHSVITGVCLLDVDSGFVALAYQTSSVQFRKLSQTEIANYVASGEGLDKAGGYGIQGLGRTLVEKFEGSFDNIVGLPLELVERMLNENGWSIERQ